jgi:hypothetical protein
VQMAASGIGVGSGGGYPGAGPGHHAPPAYQPGGTLPGGSAPGFPTAGMRTALSGGTFRSNSGGALGPHAASKGLANFQTHSVSDSSWADSLAERSMPARERHLPRVSALPGPPGLQCSAALLSSNAAQSALQLALFKVSKSTSCSVLGACAAPVCAASDVSTLACAPENRTWRPSRQSSASHPALQLSEEVEGVRSSYDVDVPLACKLDVIAGPCTNRGYTNTEDVLEVGGRAGLGWRRGGVDGWAGGDSSSDACQRVFWVPASGG